MLYTIKNDKIKLTVNSLGGSLYSLVYLPQNEERLWQGEAYWTSRDIAIFPILGHADGFTAKGKNCALKAHGIVRYSELSPEKREEDEVTLSLRSDEKTRENYPYDFYYSVTYKLTESGVKVTYFVKSEGGAMPFYVGGHPGMRAPGGSAVIEFENTERPLMYPIGRAEAVQLAQLKRFVADKQFFKECKTFQLGSLSGGAVYAFTQDGYTYRYESDCPLWAFWSNEEGGDYICVEPWWGINDYPDAPREITLKPFINFDSGKGSSFSYTLTIDKN